MHKTDTPSQRRHPLLDLPREDLDLIAELVLQSGSLKGLAESYSVSYPTIRARLDKTIGRLKAILEGTTPDPISDMLALLVERGELTLSGARQLRESIRAAAAGAESEPIQNKETE